MSAIAKPVPVEVKLTWWAIIFPLMIIWYLVIFHFFGLGFLSVLLSLVDASSSPFLLFWGCYPAFFLQYRYFRRLLLDFSDSFITISLFIIIYHLVTLIYYLVFHAALVKHWFTGEKSDLQQKGSRAAGVHVPLAPCSQTDQVRPLAVGKIQRQRDQWWWNRIGIYFTEADSWKAAD